jgi:hypothetical protein
MCVALFLVTPTQVPLSEWNEVAPAMFVKAPRGSVDEPLVAAFAGQFVYYLGGHCGCGCGWNVSDYDPYETRSLALADRDALIELLGREGVRPAKLVRCEEGDQAEPMDECSVTLDQLSSLNFEFEEFCVYDVVDSPETETPRP